MKPELLVWDHKGLRLWWTLTEVTPALASAWLRRVPPAARRSSKFPLRERIDRYIEAMRSGRWDYRTSEHPAFLLGHRLGQGHHRMLAIVESGLTVLMGVGFEREQDIPEGARKVTRREAWPCGS